MMTADHVDHLKKALEELDYDYSFDPTSLPLINNLLKDLKNLSEHCNQLEDQNQSLLKAVQNDSRLFMESANNSNETYILNVVDLANVKINDLTRELEILRRENADLKLGFQGNVHNYYKEQFT